MASKSQKQPKKALVTGGAGFIGSHVVKELLNKGIETRVLVLPGEKTRNLDGLEIEQFPGDVTDPARMKQAVKGCDWVFHLAAIYALWLPRPEKMREVNVDGTFNILLAAAEGGVKRVIHTSSIAVFGGQGSDRDATEQSPFALGKTGNLYAQTKYDAHQVARQFANDGLDVTIAAPTGPLGPGDVGPTPTGRLLLMAAVSPIAVLTDSVSNMIDVRDVAEGHLLVAEKGHTGESYLLGNQNISMREMAEMAQSAIGVKRPIVSLPRPVLKGAAKTLVFVADKITRRAPLISPSAISIAELGLRADCSKAVSKLGLPQTPLKTSIRDALRWFAENGYISSSRHRKRILRATG